MARPLTGTREVLRRLEENNTAKRERINEIRAFGGLEPLEELGSRTQLGHELMHYYQEHMFEYQRQLFERATDYPIQIIAGRPNRNYTIHEADRVHETYGPKNQVDQLYINSHWSSPYSNPCLEIFQTKDYHPDYPLSNEEKIAMRKRANKKLDSNEDFTFLLNDAE